MKFKKKQKTHLRKNIGVDNPFKSNAIKDKIAKINEERYGTKYPVILYSHLNNKTISNINKQIYEELINQGCKCQLEYRIENTSYDIFVEPNILLEINPTYTHNSTEGPYIGGKHIEPKDKWYHHDKTELATKHGFRCIHLFDFDNKDQIIKSLRPKTSVDINKCTIQYVSRVECELFLHKYSIVSYSEYFQTSAGLYYEDTLIQLITFDKVGRRSYVVRDICSNFDYEVLNGTSELIKYFIEEYDPNEITIGCDLSKFLDDYKNSGLISRGFVSPRAHWYNVKTKDHFIDNMLENKKDYVVIYDCGEHLYQYEKDIDK